jgi:hypothetical protein
MANSIPEPLETLLPRSLTAAAPTEINFLANPKTLCVQRCADRVVLLVHDAWLKTTGQAIDETAEDVSIVACNKKARTGTAVRR